MEKIKNIGKVVEIFWTGGYDSTFRIVQLSMLPVKIHPYYLSDNRKSESMELNAIKEITKLLKAKPKTQCEFLPLTIVDENERIISKEITDAYYRIFKRFFFGSQYDWLARYATEHKGIELSIHKDDTGINLIRKFGNLTEIKNDVIGKYYILDTENSLKDINVLFQFYHFPIANLAKVEMKEKYISWGYKNVMNLTWFCHSPINGEPCGKCNPCKYTIDEGLKDRFSKDALKRYRRRKYLSPIIKMKSKTTKILRGYCYKLKMKLKTVFLQE